MPELPEVETVARGLRAAITGRRILAVHLGKTDFMEDPAALKRFLPGNWIEAVERFGKFLLLRLNSANGVGATGAARRCLVVHLGMTGRLVPHPAAEPRGMHTHAAFVLDDGRELRYTDIRRFGRLAVVAEESLHEFFSELGADPLEITEEQFCGQLGERRAMVKALLLDQHVLRGIGNIYADESLWRARIHPARRAARLPRQQLAGLYRSVQAVLRAAIRLRGSSISDFVDARGEPGEYQRRHRVYQREGKSCFHCRTPIRRVIVAGRSSYFCPRCQPSPRRQKTARRKTRQKEVAG